MYCPWLQENWNLVGKEIGKQTIIFCNCLLVVRPGCQRTSETHRRNIKIMIETEG